MPIASAFSKQAKRRANGRKPSRVERLRWSPRPPNGAVLFLRMAMRQIVAGYIRRARALLTDAAIEKIVGPVRTDASDHDTLLDRLHRISDTSFGEPVVSGVVDVASKRVAKHSTAEFDRLGIRVAAQDPALAAQIVSWKRGILARVRSIAEDSHAKLAKVLSEAAGLRVEALRSRIEETFGLARSKAETLARTQILQLNAKITEGRMVAAGITEYIWTTAGDERVSEAHADLEGQRFRFDDPPTDEDGNTGNPGEIRPNCRCQAYPVIPALDDE
jgi:SPP1 gp7 family putative phage head morphogenesis protein